MNAFYNFVPNKVITIRGKDTLWVTPEIKRMVLQKVKIYQRYLKHGRSIADYQILCDITSRFKSAIKQAKSIYFIRLGESWNDPAITPKMYWSILHSFLHKRKIPKKRITSTLFLQSNATYLRQDYLLTHHRLESVNLDPAKILSIIRAFDVTKAHGWDKVNVRMVKICD